MLKDCRATRYTCPAFLSFVFRFASQQEIDQAVTSENGTGFVWVDRKGPRPEAISVDIEAGLPGFEVPFWYLKPRGNGPYPVGLFPHGHYADHGLDYAAGVGESPEMQRRIQEEDRDVAVQAVRYGFAAIAPSTRGFPPACIPDITGRHDGRNCRSQLIHALLAGSVASTRQAPAVWTTTSGATPVTTVPATAAPTSTRVTSSTSTAPPLPSTAATARPAPWPTSSGGTTARGKTRSG